MTRRLTTSVLISLALLGAAVAPAEPPKQPPPVHLVPVTPLSLPDKQALQRDAFTIITTVRALPEPVQRQLFRERPDSRGGMADPGQEFQVTDVVGPKPLPFRRLIFAASSPTCCVVFYEYGGIAYGKMAVGFRLVNGKPISAWVIYPQETRRPLDLTELRSEISRGKYHDFTKKSHL